ncbi:GNAT family N-acetyltransferase [Sulfitobacter albidus]|uniref:GNAT family N-acetyltransferase n=1 Tax=Sulfitobacter albidus TaxID=2829501 RepID=A0A975JD54_9RHOB|nr:GNAT family N-acetyltransferase [Sulfitobacter albidus]QUJ75900.1 GNAT family N-acetyltransferase [Sulfitobacter albidus]
MSLPDLILRPARAPDAPGLSDLIYRSKHSNGYDDAFMAACAHELRVTPARLIASTYWLAERGGTPLGCAALRPHTDTVGEVHAFFIDPDHKRQGIGRLLWRRLHRTAMGQGFASLILDADPAAVPFYEDLGFRWRRDVPSGSIPGRTLPQMTRPLP